MFNPKIAVLNNVSLDHKSMEELRALFGDFLARAQAAIVNADSDEVMALKDRAALTVTYGLSAKADLGADSIRVAPYGVSFTAIDRLTGARARGRAESSRPPQCLERARRHRRERRRRRAL